MSTYSNVYLSVYNKIYLLYSSYCGQLPIAYYEYDPLLLATYKVSCVSLHGQLLLTHSYAYSQLAVIGTLLCIARD